MQAEGLTIVNPIQVLMTSSEAGCMLGFPGGHSLSPWARRSGVNNAKQVLKPLQQRFTDDRIRDGERNDYDVMLPFRHLNRPLSSDG